MINVYFILLRRLLWFCANGLSVALITGVVVRALGGSATIMGYELVATFVLGGLVVGPFFLGTSPWVNHIPMRRTHLFVLATLIDFTGYILVFFGTNIIIALFSILDDGNLNHYFKLQKNIATNFIIEGPISFGLFGFAQTLMVLNFIFICWHFVGLVVGRKRTKNLNGSVKPYSSKKLPNRTPVFLAVLALVVTILAKFHSYIFFGFSMSVLIILGSTLLAFEIFIRSSGVFGETSKNWRSIGNVIGAFEVTLVVILTIYSMNSTSLARQIDAHFFLGGWAPKDEKTLTDFLSAEISYPQIDQLGAEYQKKYNSGKLLSASDKDGLQLVQLIQTKKTPQQLYSVFKIFDPKTFTSAQLTPMFEKSNGVFDLNKRTFTRYAVPASLDVSEVISYIDSPNLLMAQYGLLRARYFPDEKYFEAIERNISRYPDNLKNSSLLTLSVLTGHRVGIDDYVLYQKNKKIEGLKIASFDCDEFRTRAPSSLVVGDEAILNYCVRALAQHQNVSWVNWIEDLGWIEAPLNEKRSKYLNRLFQEKNSSPSTKTEGEESS